MSNASVAGDSHCKNWLYMDNYSGNDVGGATALGLDRTEPRAFIMQSDANRTSWNNTAALGVFTATPTSGQVVVTDGTTGGIKSSGYGISTSATANTVAVRQGNGYLYSTFYNASNGAENPASYTSYAMFKDSNGWQRCSSKDNFNAWLGCVLKSGSTMTGRLDVPYVKSVRSGYTFTTVYDGENYGTASEVGSSQIALGNGTKQGVANNSRGELCLFSTQTSYIALRAQDVTSARYLYLPASGTALATAQSSSARVKENIRDMTEEEALKILDVDVVKFDYKEDLEVVLSE